MEKREHSYTSIHNHTHYSNLRMIDAIITEETLIDKAYELGLRGVAITDHESVSGHVKALNYYKKKYGDKKDEFKLILGNEIYLTRSGLNSETHQDGEKFYHLLLLAKDEIGHRQLRELSSRAWGRSYYKNLMRTPTFQEDLIDIVGRNPGHLICTTACMSGYPGTMFMMNELEAIQPFLDSMVGIFGYENFFVEIQPTNSNEELEFNKHMIINYWDQYQFVYTTDSHYLQKEDQEVHRWFLQSKSGRSRDVDSYYSTAYIMGLEELESFFSHYLSKPKIEALRINTNKIWDMIEFYDLNREQIVPRIEFEDRFNNLHILKMKELFYENDIEKYPYLKIFFETENPSDKYLLKLILEGYYQKIYNQTEISTPERMERINYELEQIHETSKQIHQNLSDYFITMAKMIEIIWDEADSIVGPGRGSAAGFLINYLIGITQIDPMAQMLYLPP